MRRDAPNRSRPGLLPINIAHQAPNALVDAEARHRLAGRRREDAVIGTRGAALGQQLLQGLRRLVTPKRGRPAAVLNPHEAIKAEEAQVNRRPKNRRTAAVLNPYEAIKQGEQSLAMQLQSLNVEQLKDVVSEFAIDSSKLALKWKSRERLIDLIVLTTKGRLEKGDAFRTP